MTTDGAHETREEEATGARPVLPVSLQQPPESSPHGATVQATDRISTWLSRIQSLAGLEALVLGTAAIVSASIGQHILTPGDRPIANPDILGATRWYAIGIVLLIFGWWGTYRNRSLLRFPAIGSWLPRLDSLQLVLVACGILWNVLSLLVLRRNWASVPGGVLWLGSLAFLAAAFLRENVGPAPIAEDPEPDRWRIPQRVELIIFLAIMVLAFVMRAWRLGDLTPGMHGDEGEVGTDALGILHGDPAPLFERGWFNQPNMYYWSLAVFMKVFGTGLVGLRSFVVFCGLVTVLFTYLLGREMFGQRGAIIAGSFMAFQSAGLIFSRQEFSNGAI
ncbi:MAG TPA: glycosyltransferase family 39 protein, partial [Chloroflexota bacterium]